MKLSSLQDSAVPKNCIEYWIGPAIWRNNFACLEYIPTGTFNLLGPGQHYIPKNIGLVLSSLVNLSVFSLRVTPNASFLQKCWKSLKPIGPKLLVLFSSGWAIVDTALFFGVIWKLLNHFSTKLYSKRIRQIAYDQDKGDTSNQQKRDVQLQNMKAVVTCKVCNAHLWVLFVKSCCSYQLCFPILQLCG